LNAGVILCFTLSDSIKFLPTNCEEALFYSRQHSERTLVARTDFRKFKKFSLQICYLNINGGDVQRKRFLYCKKFSCDEKKNVSVCDRRKPNSCNPKNDFDRDFSARTLCIMVIIKLHPLFIYIMYMYVQKRYFRLWSEIL